MLRRACGRSAQQDFLGVLMPVRLRVYRQEPPWRRRPYPRGASVARLKFVCLRRGRLWVGTSPSCWARPSGPISISMSSSTSSAAMWSDGWSPIGRARNWPGSSSPILAPSAHHSLPTHPPRRSRLVDDFQARRHAVGRLGRDQDAQPPICQQFFPGTTPSTITRVWAC